MTSPLREVGKLFLKLGCVAYGGPAAHIAMMEEEVVRRRKWMSREHFLDLVGATHLVPGPNSTEMAMHCGHERAGWRGLFTAGICFIVPAVLITLVFAWLYGKYGSLPEAEPLIDGIRAAILAVIAAAIFKLGKKALKNAELAVMGVLVLAASLSGLNEILALLAAGVLGMFYFRGKTFFSGNRSGLWIPFTLFYPAAAVPKLLAPAGIFLKFLKVGAILYGSGYVLFAYLDAELVQAGWLTRQQLIDAVAVGQFTPGPVLSTAAFVGYQLNGFSGAVLATLGIFLPSFFFVLLLNPLIPKMRQSKWMSGFLDSVNASAVAVMSSVLIKMGGSVLGDWRAVIIAAISFTAVFGFKKLNPVWIVLGGAAGGCVLTILK